MSMYSPQQNAPHMSSDEGYRVYCTIWSILRSKKKSDPKTFKGAVANFKELSASSSTCMNGCGLFMKLLTCCICGDACFRGAATSTSIVRELKKLQDTILPLYKDDEETLTKALMEVWNILHTLSKTASVEKVLSTKICFSPDERIGYVLEGVINKTIVLNDPAMAMKVRRHAPIFSLLLPNSMTMKDAISLASGE